MKLSGLKQWWHEVNLQFEAPKTEEGKKAVEKENFKMNIKYGYYFAFAFVAVTMMFYPQFYANYVIAGIVAVLTRLRQIKKI